MDASILDSPCHICYPCSSIKGIQHDIIFLFADKKSKGTQSCNQIKNQTA